MRGRVPGGYAVSLLALWYGTTLAVLLTVAGLVIITTTAGSPTAVAGGHAPSHHHTHATGAQGRQSSLARLQVSTRDVGLLTMRISASVAMNGDEPLSGAEPVAHIDMVGMPGAHTLRPLTLEAVPGRPGRYSGRATVPMPGDYRVHVHLDSPVHVEDTTTASVGTVDES